MTFVHLPDRAAVRVGGPEAAHFLQGLITADIERVTETGAGYGALLSPQGKILFDFLVFKDGDDFLLDTLAEAAAALAKRLTFYKLRAKVTVEDLSESHAVVAGWGEPMPADGPFAIDPRLAELGWRGVVPKEAAGKSDAALWNSHRIALTVPEAGQDYAYGEVFPHDIDMDQLSGVVFDKGCYVGQEVVSRMQHRGTARRRIVAATADAALPAAGTEIAADGKAIGTLGSSDGGQGLALVRIDRAKAAMDRGAAIEADGVAITLSLPSWAKFEWPSDEAPE